MKENRVSPIEHKSIPFTWIRTRATLPSYTRKKHLTMKAILLLLRKPMRERVVKTLRGVSSPPTATKTMNVSAIITGTAIPKLKALVRARVIPPLRMRVDSSLKDTN